MRRHCLDCPRLISAGTRCAPCRAVRERLRGTPTQRGYGAEHQRARRQLAATLPAPCGYGCGTDLWPEDRWVAAHVVDGRPEYGWMVSCVDCNSKAQRRGEGGSRETPRSAAYPTLRFRTHSAA